MAFALRGREKFFPFNDNKTSPTPSAGRSGLGQGCANLILLCALSDVEDNPGELVTGDVSAVRKVMHTIGVRI